MIAVIGATGRVGTLVAAGLAEQGVAARAIVRQPCSGRTKGASSRPHRRVLPGNAFGPRPACGAREVASLHSRDEHRDAFAPTTNVARTVTRLTSKELC